MKMKKIIKITYILIIIAILLTPISNVKAIVTNCPSCNGSGQRYEPRKSGFVTCQTCSGTGKVGSSSTGAAAINPDDYKPNDLTASDYQKPFAFARTILSALVTVGVVVCIVAVMHLGIKYMVGSVEEKAEYKKTMIPIIIGMVMLICTSTFVAIIYDIVSKVNNY